MEDFLKSDEFAHILDYKGVGIFVVFALFFVWEFFWPRIILPKKTLLDRGAHWGRNLGLTLLNILLSIGFVTPFLIWLDGVSETFFSLAFVGMGAFFLHIVILDFWIYWWHRLNHMSQFLWRFHQVHHLDEQMDTTTAFRFHFGEVFLSSLFRAPIILFLGIPLIHIIIFEMLVSCAALFQHSNIRLSEKLDGVLRFVIVTPNHHWTHHHAKREDTDSNYGTIFSFWDRCFGSFNRFKRYSGMKIGVAGFREKSFIRLLFLPLKKVPQKRHDTASK